MKKMPSSSLSGVIILLAGMAFAATGAHAKQADTGKAPAERRESGNPPRITVAPESRVTLPATASRVA